MLRSLFSIVAVLVLTIVLGIPAVVLSLVHPQGDWVIRIGRVWARGICAAAGVRIRASGLENLPERPPYLLVSNHQSHFDLIAIILSFPSSFRVVAKRFLFFIPIFGWCLAASGMIPIDRKKRQQAFQSLEHAAEKAKTGVPILFFVEGTRTRDGALLPFKKGAFVIAIQSGLPMVPVSVSGSRAILPRGSGRIRPGTIAIRYGRPIPVDDVTLAEKDALIARVRSAIEDGLARNDGSGSPPGARREAGSGAALSTR